MSESAAEKYLSKLERNRLEALVKYNSIKEASKALGTSPQTLYNWLYQFRNKYKKRRGWVNSVLAQRRRTNFMRKILSERRPLADIDDEDEEKW
jgi:transposase-like protein